MPNQGKAHALVIMVCLLSACSDGVKQASIDSTLDDLLSKAIRDQRFIEGGTFEMGDFGATQNGQWLPYFPPTAEIDKAHTVHLSNYSLSAYETTWQDFDTFNLIHDRPIVIRGGGEEYAREPYVQNLEDEYHSSKPARVTWREAKDYCLWLADKTGIAFDLPTSAQWEFAARNRGSKDWLYPTHNGKIAPDSDERNGKGCNFWTGRCSVGTDLPPNPLGLYDMAGNATEWVNDWYSETYYQESDGAKDPQGPLDGTEKVIRSLRLGSLSFSFSLTSYPETLSDGSLGLAGFRCAVQSPEPVGSFTSAP